MPLPFSSVVSPSSSSLRLAPTPLSGVQCETRLHQRVWVRCSTSVTEMPNLVDLALDLGLSPSWVGASV